MSLVELLTSKSVTDFEPEARLLCDIRLEDPARVVPVPHPKGFLVGKRQPLWRMYAAELLHQWQVYVLVSQHDGYRRDYSLQ